LFIDRIIVVCTVVLALLYFYGASLIPSLQIGDPLGPKAFPYLIGIGLLVSAAWLLLETLQAAKSGVADPPDLADQADQADRAPEDNRHLLVIAGVVAWIAFYFALFEPVGFLLATPVSLLGLMVYFNRNKWVANVLTSVLFPVGIYFLFSKVLGVNLAKGLLPF
jgi:putative tricarboxylic transport membrane protein